MNIAIVGAGHAGVEAARVAAEGGAQVRLFSREATLPYFRPRLVALAFGQTEESAIAMHPEAWYRERGLDLRLGSSVTHIDVHTGTVQSETDTAAFDAVVLATGAAPMLPPFAATCPWCVLPLWTIDHARAIRARVRSGAHVVVIGGGVLGLETALRALDAGLRVTIVERLKRLMPMQFGDRASAIILQRVQSRGVDVRLGRSVSHATASGGSNDGLTIHTDAGDALSADLCIVSIGARPDLALARRCGLGTGHGVKADAFLQTSAPRVWTAGDIVQLNGMGACSASGAALQGRLAARNALAVLRGEAPSPYHAPSLPVMLKTRDVELYSTGDVAATDEEELPLDGTTDSALRTLVIREGLTVGVQMVGTRKGFDEYASLIGQPPQHPS